MYHGYLPAEFTKTTIRPIIKCKIMDYSNKINNRPTVLVITCSKSFELCLIDIIELYLSGIGYPGKIIL